MFRDGRDLENLYSNILIFQIRNRYSERESDMPEITQGQAYNSGLLISLLVLLSYKSLI